MPYDLWKSETDGALTSETTEFRLTISRVGNGLRFFVFRKSTRSEDVHTLVASGTRQTVVEAMKQAIATAMQFRDLQRFEIGASRGAGEDL